MTYRAQVALIYPASAEVDARLRAAADLPEAERAAVVAAAWNGGEMRRCEPGQTADDLPDGSIGWLLEQGLIEPVSAAPQAFGEPDAVARGPVLGE